MKSPRWARSAARPGATFYNWLKKYAGLTQSEVKRLRQLEEQNGKLTKIVADLSLDKAMLHDVIRRKVLKPCPAGANGGLCTFELADEHSTRLPCVAGRTIALPRPHLYPFVPTPCHDATTPLGLRLL